VRLASPVGSAAGGSVNLSTSLSNVAKLAAHPKFVWVFNANFDGMGQSLMTLYNIGTNGKLYTGCLRVAKKLHNLLVIKDINFSFFLDESYVSTAHSENIAVYLQSVPIL
jgi:hypothetical protein